MIVYVCVVCGFFEKFGLENINVQRKMWEEYEKRVYYLYDKADYYVDG